MFVLHRKVNETLCLNFKPLMNRDTMLINSKLYKINIIMIITITIILYYRILNKYNTK